MLPYFFSHERQCIRKGGPRLGVPGRLPDRDAVVPGVRGGQQGHQREQAQQSWSGAQDRPIRPLPLSFHAEMVPDFMKGDFELPTHDEPLQDLFRVSGQVSTQQGLRFEFAFRIPNQEPADGQRRQAIVEPNRSRGSGLHFPFALTIPIWNIAFFQ